MNLLWLPCCLVWLLVAYPGSSWATLSPDGLALLEFKSLITSDPNGALVNWKASDDTPCGWTGMICVASGTGAANASVVSGLNLTNAHMEGSLSASLGSLANLTSLDLSFNRLSGSIPANMSQLQRLLYLDLSGNSLGGPIPALGGLTNLEHLDLSSNDFISDVGTLQDLARMTKLEVLKFIGNLTGGNFPDLSASQRLQVLSMRGAQLEGPLPSWVDSMPSLTWLDLSRNNLSGEFPPGMWSNLSHIDSSWNNLSGEILPGMWSNSTSLSYIDLSRNNLSGEFPPGIWSTSTSLSHIDLSWNNLSGEIPPGMWSNNTSLSHIDLSWNSLSGEIVPGMWSNSTSLEYIDLSSNQIGGAIALDFLQRSSNWELNLSSNRLTGNMPGGGNGSALPRSLDLSNNELDGPIPTWMISSSSLVSLFLQNNRLYGDIPSLWSNVNQSEVVLSELGLQGNQLSGNIGAATCARWDGLLMLDLSHNSGVNLVDNSLELMLTNLSRLAELYLSNISSSGSLHPSARTATERTFDSPLKVLDVSHSNLEGDLSQSIFADANLRFPRLTSLNLSGNRLTGQVPPRLTVMPNLLVLDLSNNRLSGPLPALFPHLQNASFFAGNPGLCGLPLDPCKPPPRQSLVLPLAVALVGCFLLFAASCVLFAWCLRKSNLRHQQDAELIAMMQGENSANLMPLGELRKATSNFSQESQIGVGGFGTVYKGTLKDGTTVAIKRSKRQGSQQQKEQFLNEVNILSHVNHRNLVRLRGCCLENKVALLVFEYVPNGTLQDHLRNPIPAPLTWEERVRIALQTADALAYLHSAANPPIFHRDVKSANILLDDDMNAKVADFGISKLVPLDATHVSTKAVQGTMGYIDPEYYTGLKLSAKSDVYSFGVVLLELISAQAAIDFGRDPEEAALSTFAVSVICRGDLEDIIDPTIARIFADSDAGKESIAGVAALAVKCLAPRSRDRPSMLDLSRDLRSLWLQLDPPADANVSTDDHGQQDSGLVHTEHVVSIDGAFLSEPSLLGSYKFGR